MEEKKPTSEGDPQSSSEDFKKAGEKKKDDAAKSDDSKDSALRGCTFSGIDFDVPATSPPWNFVPWTWDVGDALAMTCQLYWIIPFTSLPKYVSVMIFVFWRLMYNFFVGYLLDQQSKNELVVRLYKRWKNNFILKYLLARDGFDKDEYPDEFKGWILFRYFVDLILGHDLGGFVLVCVVFWEIPAEFSLGEVLLYCVSIVLFAVAGWAKRDAYRVIGDYAWYWGDFFFLIKRQLKFDRVFSLSPHPMYTLGYLFMYGAALMCRSFTVLYVGLFGHACQFIFLNFVENPHIEKIYKSMQEDKSSDDKAKEKGYLRDDMVFFKNFNPFRASDLFSAVIVLQHFVLVVMNIPFHIHVILIVFWRLVHTIGLGVLLVNQSKFDAMVVYYEKQGWTRHDAFDGWKKIYNLSSSMQWVTFVSAAISCYPYSGWLGGSWNVLLTKHLIGFALILLNVWSSLSNFATVGEFGWFYGDFFVPQIGVELSYEGLFRFLNDPDSIIGFAAFYGLALMCDNVPLFFLAVFGQFASYVFVVIVERPHMERMYGNTVRKNSGLVNAIGEIMEETPQMRKVVSNAKLFHEKVEVVVDMVVEKVEKVVEMQPKKDKSE